jgi:hypothetical protein
MHSEETLRQVALVPHYKEPHRHKEVDIAYPFDLQVAVDIFGKEIIPDILGIYHLFYKGRLVYIGMSKNLRGRLLYHLKDPEKVFDAVLWFDCKDRSLENVLTIEANMIRHFVPPLNIECISGGY